MMPPEQYPHESRDQSPHKPINQSDESVEATEILKRLIARRAFMEPIGIAGVRPAPADSADDKSGVYGLAQEEGFLRYIGAPECDGGVSPSEILNHALMLEFIETEFSTVISSGNNSQAIRPSIEKNQSGFSIPDAGRLQCTVTVRVGHNFAIESSPEIPVANARSKPARNSSRNSHRPRRSSSSAPGKRRSLTSSTHPRSRNTTDHPRRRPRSPRSHSPLS